MSFPVLTIDGQAFAVAPYFRLEGDWRTWLEVACEDGWRPPPAEEIERWSNQGRRSGSAVLSLFALPADRRSAFWALLQAGGAAGFQGFAEDVASYLAYRQLSPPEGAVFELVACPAGGVAELGERAWAVVNVADAEAFAVRGGVRLRLVPGAGCRVVEGLSVQGAAGEEPGLLLVMRGGG